MAPMIDTKAIVSVVVGVLVANWVQKNFLK